SGGALRQHATHEPDGRQWNTRENDDPKCISKHGRRLSARTSWPRWPTDCICSALNHGSGESQSVKKLMCESQSSQGAAQTLRWCGIFVAVRSLSRLLLRTMRVMWCRAVA